MKTTLNIIQNNSYIYTQKKNKNTNNQQKYNRENISVNTCYLPNFRSNIPLNKLYEEYNWYINCDRTPAIHSFLKMNYPKEVMNKFLTELLTTDRSHQLIDSIVSEPRNTQYFLNALKDKVGENSENLLTFIPHFPYYKAYNSYIEEKYKNARNLSELLKVRPDWTGKALMEKYQSKANNDKLKIGNIPKQIPKEHLFQIVNYLKNNMEIGVKNSKEIPGMVIDGRTYIFQFFTEGKSSKNVFGVFVPAMAKKYVIKIDDPHNRSLDNPFALGTLAKIDKYLTSHRSRNSAPLCYYDHEHNFSIYKYIEHELIGEDYSTTDKIMKHLPDFKKLGLVYNDTVGVKNFFILSDKSSDTHYETEGFAEALNKSEWISVDNDHVTYSNRFQPSITKYNAPLPNGMQMFF